MHRSKFLTLPAPEFNTHIRHTYNQVYSKALNRLFRSQRQALIYLYQTRYTHPDLERDSWTAVEQAFGYTLRKNNLKADFAGLDWERL